MAATVTARLALDSSGFTAGLTRAQAALGKLSAVGVPVMAAGFAAAAAAAGALAVGIKKAVDIGGALSELSARTGVAAGELRVLQLAFMRAGMSAEQVGPSVNRMQRAIFEASTGSKEAQKSFENIGLSLEALRSLSPEEQFKAIGQAIGGLKDPAAQTAATMQIFGRGAGNLLAIFKDSGALGDAARAIGFQAELLSKNAVQFDRASDILNTSGAKLEGFFVGVADELVPALMPLLENADALDLSKAGQSFGKEIGLAVSFLTSGEIGNVLTAQFKLAGANFVNELSKGVAFITAFMQQRFTDIPSDFVTILSSVTKPDFWRGLGNGLLAVVQKIAAVLQNSVADVLQKLSTVPFLSSMGAPVGDLRRAAGIAQTESDANFSRANDAIANPLKNVRDKIADSFNRAAAAGALAIENAGESIDTTQLVAARDQLLESVKAQFESNQAAVRARFEASKTMLPGMDGEGGMQRGSNTGIIAQSLQKVGGGAAFARFSDAANPAAQQLREQQKANGFLARIEQKLSPQMALMPA